ncbi:MAG: hypothetical protein ACRDHP_00820 [Ktedonobacterales bacterium]
MRTNILTDRLHRDHSPVVSLARRVAIGAAVAAALAIPFASASARTHAPSHSASPATHQVVVGRYPQCPGTDSPC